MTYSAEVLADTPLVYLRFGDASGTTATDSSGNAHNGIYTGSPTLGVRGLIKDANTAMTLNGTSQWATVAGASYQNVTNYTVEFWVKTTATAGPADIACRDDSSSKVWDIQLPGTGTGQIQFVTFNGGTGQSLFSTGSISDGLAHHVACVKSGTTVLLYLDGALNNSTTFTTFDAFTTVALDIGRRGNSTNLFPGTVDEYAYYGTALSATRIAAHYTAGLVSTYATEVLADSPLAFWKLDELTGATTFTDSSGSARSLTETGTVTFSQSPAARQPGTSIALAGAGGGYVASPAYLTSITTFTIEFWAKWTSTADMILLARDNVALSPTQPERVWTINTDFSGHPYFECYTTAGGSNAVASTTALNNGNWHHIVVTFSSGALAMYVDGVFNSTATLPGTLNSGIDTGSSTWFSIGGGDNNSPLNYHLFTGSLDSVAVYGSALSPTRIAAHYSAGTAAAYFSAVTGDAPLVYLRLGELAGSTAVDSSTNLRNGTYVSSPTLGIPGIPGAAGDTAATFNGSTSWVTVPATGLPAVDQDQTIECWVKYTTTTDALFIASRDASSTRGMSVLTKTGGLLRTGNTGSGYAESTLAYNDGQWHHVVGVRRASAGFFDLYVDGRLVASASFANSVGATGFFVAVRGDGTLPFPGTVDEVAYYGAALSATQIATHYVYGANVSYASAVLADLPEIYLKLDESAGSVIADSSGNGRPGAYNGATLGQPALFPGSIASVLGTASGLGVGSVPDGAWMNNAVYSVELWVKPTNAGDIVGLAARFQGFAAGAWLFWQRSGELRFLVETSGAQFDLTGPTFVIGTAYYLVGTYDGTTQRLYVNGVQFSSQAVAGAGAGFFNLDIQLGGYNGGNLSSANLDDFAVYGTVLSPSAVLVHYTAALAALAAPTAPFIPQSLFTARRAVLARSSTR